MLPCVTLVRHGETAWSASGQHTGRTDIPLTEEGERKARALGDRLKGVTFDRVFTSPLQRAARTCALAGFGAAAKVDPDLLEWDYGDYEGRKSSEILADRPGWLLFRDGCPNGESPADVGRAGRPRRRPPSRGGRPRDRVFERPHPEGPGVALARPRAVRRTSLQARHREHKHPRLRARQGRAGDRPLERGLRVSALCQGQVDCCGGASRLLAMSARIKEVSFVKIQGLPGMLDPKHARREPATRIARVRRRDHRRDP